VLVITKKRKSFLDSEIINKMTFCCKTFAELDTSSLYEILDLRNRIFVMEQNCPYIDTDFKDQDSFHILGRDDSGLLMCYCRILPVGLSYDNHVSIGRVVTSEKGRGQGLGKKLMIYAVQKTQELFPNINIQIAAQSYLIDFYQCFGFEPIGVDYLLDNIPHREMMYTYG